ncbi:MAG: alpha/beta hydrolase [bacterium]
MVYAEKSPNEIKALAPISTLISGELSKMKYSAEELAEREKTGRQIRPRSNGGIKKLKWSHFIDRMKYNIIPNAKNLTMPVLMIVGDVDKSAPIIHQQLLFDQVPNKKELHIIRGAAHDFKEPHHVEEIYQIFDKRIKKL